MENCYADMNSMMHEIISVVQQPDTTNLWVAGYMCRDKYECNKVAVVMKIDSEDGQIHFLKQFGVQDENAQTILDTFKLISPGNGDWAT